MQDLQNRLLQYYQIKNLENRTKLGTVIGNLVYVLFLPQISKMRYFATQNVIIFLYNKLSFDFNYFKAFNSSNIKYYIANL